MSKSGVAYSISENGTRVIINPKLTETELREALRETALAWEAARKRDGAYRIIFAMSEAWGDPANAVRQADDDILVRRMRELVPEYDRLVDLIRELSRDLTNEGRTYTAEELIALRKRVADVLPDAPESWRSNS